MDTASTQPQAPYQQEAADDFYPQEVIDAEPKGQEAIGEHDEKLAEIADENKDKSPKDDKSKKAGWEADNGHVPDVTSSGAKSDNRDGTLDGASTRATQEAAKADRNRA